MGVGGENENPIQLTEDYMENTKPRMRTRQ